MKTFRNEPIEKRRQLVKALLERTLEHVRELGMEVKLCYGPGKVKINTGRLWIEPLKGLIVACLVTLSAYAGTVRLAWSPSPSVGVTNYVVTGVSGTNYVSYSAGDNLAVTVEFQGISQWTFTVQAERDMVLSDPTSPIVVEAPESPTNARTVAVERVVSFSGTNQVELFRLKFLP